jgi:DNA-binding NtrC family response regulator
VRDDGTRLTLAGRPLGFQADSRGTPVALAPGVVRRLLRGTAVGAVIIVEDAKGQWGPDMEALLRAHGHRVARVKDLASVPFLLLSGGIVALVLEGRKLAASDALALAKCRRLAPAMSLIFVTRDSSRVDLVQAMDDGATAVLSWPESASTLLDLLHRERA